MYSDKVNLLKKFYNLFSNRKTEYKKNGFSVFSIQKILKQRHVKEFRINQLKLFNLSVHDSSLDIS